MLISSPSPLRAPHDSEYTSFTPHSTVQRREDGDTVIDTVTSGNNPRPLSQATTIRGGSVPELTEKQHSVAIAALNIAERMQLDNISNQVINESLALHMRGHSPNEITQGGLDVQQVNRYNLGNSRDVAEFSGMARALRQAEDPNQTQSGRQIDASDVAGLRSADLSNVRPVVTAQPSTYNEDFYSF